MRYLESRRSESVRARLRRWRDLPFRGRNKLSGHSRSRTTSARRERPGACTRRFANSLDACRHVSVLGHVFKQRLPGHSNINWFNIHSYYPNNTEGVLENGENGIVPTALAIGLRQSSARVPEAGSFKATIVDVSVHTHSFGYWDQVKSEVI